jgi:hypothetical protein
VQVKRGSSGDITITVVVNSFYRFKAIGGKIAEGQFAIVG